MENEPRASLYAITCVVLFLAFVLVMAIILTAIATGAPFR